MIASESQSQARPPKGATRPGQHPIWRQRPLSFTTGVGKAKELDHSFVRVARDSLRVAARPLWQMYDIVTTGDSGEAER
jgi:hypothetical protein